MNETRFFQTKYHEVHAYQHREGLNVPAGNHSIKEGDWVVLPNNTLEVIVLSPSAFKYLFRPETAEDRPGISENTD